MFELKVLEEATDEIASSPERHQLENKIVLFRNFGN